ncbi:MAG: methyltransferase domain-containing protein [Cyanobacteria bacterium J06627_8]
MTIAVSQAKPQIARKVVSGLLAVKPLWNLAKWQARTMMINRAERLGIPWRETVQRFESHNWQADWESIQDAELSYPGNYRASFHGYDEGHLCWQAAFEFEVASNAVHSKLFPEAGTQSDAKLRQSYHDVLKAKLPYQPQFILDLHCTVGLSAFALKSLYPQAQVTGLDFSPYYLSVAHYQAQQRQENSIHWIHALPEATGLAAQSFDLVSAFLLFHEMPQDTIRKIFKEARRLVKPGGYFTFMDMNPNSAAYTTMPPYVMTLLKSTEPFMEQYFALDIEDALLSAGFDQVTETINSTRHRTVIAQVRI